MAARAKKRLAECMKMRGEDVLLRKRLGRRRKQRNVLTVEFNIFCNQRLFVNMGWGRPPCFQTTQSIVEL